MANPPDSTISRAPIGKEDDAEASDVSSSWSAIAVLKGIWTRCGAPVLAAGSAIIGKVGIDQTTPGTTNLVAANGDVAHDAADSGNPVKVGAMARTSNPAAVANADRVNFIADKLGKQITVGAIRELKGLQKTTITTSTGETTIVSAVASTYLDLYGLILANTSATIVTVTIRDTTGGSAIAIIEVPANDTRGFMLPVDSAIPQTTVNTNWTAQGDASITSLEITALYVKNV